MRNVNPLDLVETIREGILVLEPDLTSASPTARSTTPSPSRRRIPSGASSMRSATDSGTSPGLRTALDAILPGQETIEAFEVDHVFPSIGRRVMVLNARKVYRPGGKRQQILLAIEDVTERTRARARGRARAVDRLLQELTAPGQEQPRSSSPRW